MLSPQLKSKIRQLWDAIWSGGIANPLTAIEQITYLVFLKRLEDLDIEREKNARAAKQPYKSIFDFPAITDTDSDGKIIRIIRPAGETFRWKYIKELPTDERFEHVRKFVFDWLKELEGGDQERMRDAVFLIPNANLLTRAVTILDDLFVPQRNQDTLGDIYEDLLQEIAVAGKNGQFRTPRHIIRAMCDLVDVKYGDRVADPACGTGGFLINAYQHILESNTSPDILRFADDGTPLHAIGDKLTADEHAELRRNHLHGFDFDRTMVRLGWMNMIQHGLETPKIDYADSLGSKFFSKHLDLNNRDEAGKDKDGNQLYAEYFDVVLANPPFTGNIDKSDVGETLNSLGTNKTELLFVDLILQLLKPGGRAAVIVPEGVLFGSSNAHLKLRRKLIEQTQIQAVISLPGGVFQPYTGVKTSILVFAKGGKTENIWFYEVGADGEALNAKRTPDAEHNDLWDLRLKFKLRYAQQPPAFLRPHNAEWLAWQRLSSEEQRLRYLQPQFTEADETDEDGNTLLVREVNDFITNDLKVAKDWTALQTELAEKDESLSARRYKPFALDETEHADPTALIAELQELEGKIQGGLDTLLAMMEGKVE
jgi:type I restriction enzyme M protein